MESYEVLDKVQKDQELNFLSQKKYVWREFLLSKLFELRKKVNEEEGTSEYKRRKLRKITYKNLHSKYSLFYKFFFNTCKSDTNESETEYEIQIGSPIKARRRRKKKRINLMQKKDEEMLKKVNGLMDKFILLFIDFVSTSITIEKLKLKLEVNEIRRIEYQKEIQKKIKFKSSRNIEEENNEAKKFSQKKEKLKGLIDVELNKNTKTVCRISFLYSQLIQRVKFKGETEKEMKFYEAFYFIINRIFSRKLYEENVVSPSLFGRISMEICRLFNSSSLITNYSLSPNQITKENQKKKVVINPKTNKIIQFEEKANSLRYKTSPLIQMIYPNHTFSIGNYEHKFRITKTCFNLGKEDFSYVKAGKNSKNKRKKRPEFELFDFYEHINYNKKRNNDKNEFVQDVQTKEEFDTIKYDEFTINQSNKLTNLAQKMKKEIMDGNEIDKIVLSTFEKTTESNVHSRRKSGRSSRFVSPRSINIRSLNKRSAGNRKKIFMARKMKNKIKM